MKKRKEIKEYKKNNNLDLKKIIEEYSGYVYQIIKNKAIQYLSNEDVEEIVADTFFILWKNREKLQEEKVLSSYIAGIVKKLIKEKTRVIHMNCDIFEYENTIQDNIKIDMICEQREEIEMIERIVKNRKKEDIEIFNLYYYSEMKISEIAKKMKISEFNVKSRLYRMRKKINKELEKGGYRNEEPTK